jgi:hypothetical protein
MTAEHAAGEARWQATQAVAGLLAAAPAVGPCPEAAHADLVEKREPRGDVEVEEKMEAGRRQTAIRERRYAHLYYE